MSRTLTFYFDYISHNAYIAWARLPDLAERYDLEIEPVPVLFAGLLDAHGGLGPAEIPAKARWMARDVMRKAILLGIPLRPPASHPFRPLLALRASSLPMSADERRRLIDGLFAATWAESRDVSDEAVVADVAERAGLDGRAVVRRASEPASKALLRERTDAAVAAGVFGVPTMCVGDELFWGYDDWPHLELWLRGEDPLRPGDFDAWTAVRPTAQRKRRAARGS